MRAAALLVLLGTWLCGLQSVAAWARMACRQRVFTLASSNEFAPKPFTPTSLDHELDTFFETAAKSGSKRITKLTPQERADMTVKGAALEDLIYESRDRLLDLENEYMGKPTDELAQEISQLREEIAGLKDDYILIVGAQDLPLYFGKPHQ